MDQTTFFSSSDIQYLRIGTILKGGLLLPPSLDPATTVEHSYNLMSVSCSPQRGLEVARNFLSLFSAQTQGQGGLVFEVKFRAQQFWQMRIRFLINAESAEKLEEFSRNSAATIWQSRQNSMLKRSQCQRTIVKSGEGFATGCNRKGVST